MPWNEESMCKGKKKKQKQTNKKNSSHRMEKIFKKSQGDKSSFICWREQDDRKFKILR